jgi:hypothetical protein
VADHPTLPRPSGEDADNNAPPRADLAAILKDAWARLDRGAASGRHPFHTPVLSTHAPDGPDARVVVLRRVDLPGRALLCHTDARSPKVDQLRDRPVAAWTFYDAPAKLQLRLVGPTTLHTDDDLADQQWRASSPSSRRCYLAPHPPGDPADGPSPNLPEAVRGRVPDEPETRPGRTQFAVIRTVVQRLDWLDLHHAGHRRARFTWPADAPRIDRWLHV